MFYEGLHMKRANGTQISGRAKSLLKCFTSFQGTLWELRWLSRQANGSNRSRFGDEVARSIAVEGLKKIKCTLSFFFSFCVLLMDFVDKMILSAHWEKSPL